MSLSAEEKPGERDLSLKWTKLSAHKSSEEGLRHGTVTLVGKRVYWASGKGKLGVLSCTTWKWSLYPAALPAMGNGLVSQLVDDKIYYLGGTKTDSLVEYDIVRKVAKQVVTSEEGALGHMWMSSVFSPKRNEIITFGGLNKRRRESNETFAMNVETKSWKMLDLRGSRPPPRASHAALLHGSCMYIFGGFDITHKYLGDLWIAHLSTWSVPMWSQPRTYGEIPGPRTQVPLNNFNGQFILFGGFRRLFIGMGELNIYDPRTKVWKNLKSARVSCSGAFPSNISSQHGISTSTGILYLTRVGMYLLSQK